MHSCHHTQYKIADFHLNFFADFHQNKILITSIATARLIKYRHTPLAKKSKQSPELLQNHLLLPF